MTLHLDVGRSNGQETSEITGQQTRVAIVSGGELSKTRESATLTAAKVREMRKDPTIRFVRALTVAPIVASEWGYESSDDAPEGAVELIKEQFDPQRIHIQRNVMMGEIDFGWAPFEKVFDIDENGMHRLRKLKALLQDITFVFVFPDGKFAGFSNEPTNTTAKVFVELPRAMLFTQDQEGDNWYGMSTMVSVEQPYDDWLSLDKASQRYDKKIAGSHWVVHYPEGSSEIDGVITDNFEVAQTLLRSLEASGSIAVPTSARDVVTELNSQSSSAWEIELISDTPKQYAFTARQQYFDKLKVRAFGWPERSILEGEFGTKAEAGEHASFALSNVEVRHQVMVQALNFHAVNQVLVLNYGPQAANTVWIKPMPLSDQTRKFFERLYEKLLSLPTLQAFESAKLDIDAIRERLGIPVVDEDEALGLLDELMPTPVVPTRLPPVPTATPAPTTAPIATTPTAIRGQPTTAPVVPRQ